MILKNKKTCFLFFLAIVIAIQLCGSFFTFSSIRQWYPSLEKPFWTPPKWVFGPAWTVLYICIATAGWLVFQTVDSYKKRKALFFYSLQLIFNFLWSYLFFYLQSPLLGLIDIFFLFFSIIASMYYFYVVSKKALILFTPYAFWVAYALSLNLGIYLLN